VVDDGVVIVIYTFFFFLHVDIAAAAAAAAVLSVFLSPVRLTMRGEACCWQNVPAMGLDCVIRGNRCSQLHLDCVVRHRESVLCHFLTFCPPRVRQLQAHSVVRLEEADGSELL
jgi:hypothetical protein